MICNKLINQSWTCGNVHVQTPICVWHGSLEVSLRCIAAHVQKE